MTESGLQYKDYKEGTGEVPKDGDTAIVDWGGYTIGKRMGLEATIRVFIQ
jgi:FKBP-type peptidyl-prolyl cis-trans isomerase